MNHSPEKNKCYIISGPTASGKTGVSIQLAKRIVDQNPVILNADSLQIYKGLPLLTAVPDLEERQGIPHRLFECLEPEQECSVGLWWELITEQLKICFDQGQTPIIVGGTGMYVSALLFGLPATPEVDESYRQQAETLLAEVGNETFHAMLSEIDPVLASRLEVGDSQRMSRGWEVFQATRTPLSVWQEKPYKKIPFDVSWSFTRLMPEREWLYDRCNRRFEQMLDQGALDEVKTFINQYGGDYIPACKALGYPQLKAYLDGKIPLEDAVTEAQKQTRRYAKRQLTWHRSQFAKEKLDGIVDEWFSFDPKTDTDMVKEILS